MGRNNPVSLTHSSNALTISGNNKLQFNNSNTFIHSNADNKILLSSSGTSSDAIKLSSTNGGITLDTGSNGLKIIGTTPKITIGDGGAENTMMVFDGNAQDYRIGLNDSTDIFEIGVGSTAGTNNALTINSSNLVTINDNLTIASDSSVFKWAQMIL